MTGKDCVAIASDLRYGVQQLTLASNKPKVCCLSFALFPIGHLSACPRRRRSPAGAQVFRVNERIFIGLSGLATDIQTVYEKLKFRVNLYQLREERDIEPKPFASMVSSVLYERRYWLSRSHSLWCSHVRPHTALDPTLPSPSLPASTATIGPTSAPWISSARRS
jgi:20S proteasome subunit beta 3